MSFHEEFLSEEEQKNEELFKVFSRRIFPDGVERAKDVSKCVQSVSNFGQFVTPIVSKTEACKALGVSLSELCERIELFNNDSQFGIDIHGEFLAMEYAGMNYGRSLTE